jgi:N-acetylglucosamine repressor
MKKFTRQELKNHNKRLILQTIYQSSRSSRAEVARQTGLTRTTVSDLVAELIKEHLVVEQGYGPSAGGTPPMMIEVMDSARQMIGIDLANDEFRGGLLDMRGHVSELTKLPLKNRRGEEAIQLMYDLIDRLLKKADSPILGIGIGSPGVLDARNGIVRIAVNLGWVNLPLSDRLRERYQQPVYVANDSHIAAFGEFTFGSKPPGRNLAVLKVGRGISAGIVINGRIYYGDTFGAGEIGHVVVDRGGKLCSCGKRGCLETVASTRAIVSLCQQIIQEQPELFPNSVLSNPENMETSDVLEAFEMGNAAVAEIIRNAGSYLGYALSFLIATLNIVDIRIAGSLARFGDPLLDTIRETVHECTLSTLVRDTHIELASLGQNIVLQGAGAIVLSNELKLV